MKRPLKYANPAVPVYAVGAAGFWLDHWRLVARDPERMRQAAKAAEIRAHLQRISDAIFPST